MSISAVTIISCFSLLISIGAFLYPIVLRFWIERPKLDISLRNATFTNTELSQRREMTQILFINNGYRPIIIQEVIYDTKNNGRGFCGIYDQMKAPNIAEIVLPKLLKSCEYFEFNFLERTSMNRVRSISIFDSLGRKYQISEKELDVFMKLGHCSLPD